MFSKMRDEREGPSEVRPESLNDPLMSDFTGPEPTEPEGLTPGCYWRLRPGEVIDEIAELPHYHSSRPAIYFGGPDLELVVDGDSGRRHLPVPTNAGDGPPDEVACTFLSIMVVHRATGHVNEPDRYLEVLNASEEPLARIDDSASWEFRADSLQRICDLSGIAVEFEHYESEAELLTARPMFTPAHVELEVDHPIEADVRDFGNALWIGTIICFALVGAGGMEFIFATPVKYAVVTLAAAGLGVATTISMWSRIRWKKKKRFH